MQRWQVSIWASYYFLLQIVVDGIHVYKQSSYGYPESDAIDIDDVP